MSAVVFWSGKIQVSMLGIFEQYFFIFFAYLIWVPPTLAKTAFLTFEQYFRISSKIFFIDNFVSIFY
jgi:hypothetical protein